MPRRRRTTRSSRRAPRRPDFAAEPQQQAPADDSEPEERTDLDGNPIFADEVPMSGAAEAYTGPGPVETRPEWIGRTATQEAPRRQPGRRTAQLRQRGTSEGAARIMAGQLPTFERSYIMGELRRIAIISGALFAAIIVMTFLLR
jgi:hypothetical protein